MPSSEYRTRDMNHVLILKMLCITLFHHFIIIESIFFSTHLSFNLHFGSQTIIIEKGRQNNN